MRGDPSQVKAKLSELLGQIEEDKRWLSTAGAAERGPANEPEAAAVRRRLMQRHRRFQKLVGQQRALWAKQVTHQEARSSGPPCVYCGEFLRTPKAKLCAACWRYRGTRLDGLLFRVGRFSGRLAPRALLSRMRGGSDAKGEGTKPAATGKALRHAPPPPQGSEKPPPSAEGMVAARRRDSAHLARATLFAAVFLWALSSPHWATGDLLTRLLVVAAIGWPLSASVKHLWWWATRRTFTAFPGVRRRCQHGDAAVLELELNEAFRRHTALWVGGNVLVGLWLLRPVPFGDLEALRLDEFVWMYSGGFERTCTVWLRDGRRLALHIKDADDELLLFLAVQSTVPWVLRGFDEQVHALAQRDFAGLVRLVDGLRRKEAGPASATA